MRVFMALVIVLVTGCGGASIEGGDGQEQMTGQGASGPQASDGSPRNTAGRPAQSGGGSSPVSGGSSPGGQPAAGPSAGVDAPAHCGEPGDVVMLQSPDDLRQHLVGAWLYCSGWQIFNIAHDGIEIGEDGIFHFLARSDDGALVRRKGFDGSGTWTLIDNDANGPGVYQVNFDMVQGGNPSFPAFQAEPTAMRLSTMVGPADYVASEEPVLAAD